MAYLIVSQAGHELKRIELCKSPVVIGRSPECDLALHDILLSRRHCRLTPTTDGWLLIDLASRNGTRVGDRKIEQRFLKDGDVVRLGKTQITFHAGAFAPAPRTSKRPPLPTPIDPGETLSATMDGLRFVDSETQSPASDRIPSPKPRPRDPESFASDDLYSMLEQIASSSWDSIYAVNAQPLRRNLPTPRPVPPNAQGVHRLKSPIAQPKVSMALQAQTTAVQEIADIQRTMGLIQPVKHRSRKVRPIAKPRLRRLTRWAGRVGLLFIF